MTKEELVDKIAKEAIVTKVQANKAIAAFFNGVTTTLKKGQKVSFVGFGTFSVVSRKARKGRNPQTGKEIKIKASKTVKFKPGKSLKKSVA